MNIRMIFLSVSYTHLLHLLHNQLAGLHPEVVVSCEQLDFSVVNVSYLGADFIQEITVMGYHDNCILKVNQKLLQPRNGLSLIHIS